MNWIGLADHDDGRFAASGLGHTAHPISGEADLHRGTLMFEMQIAEHNQRHDIFGIVQETHALMFQAVPGGGIAMMHRDGDDMIHAAINATGEARAQTLRVSYAWDASTGWARLSVEHPETAKVVTNPVHAARPQNLAILKDLMLGTGARALSRDVIFGAISTDIAPIGPMPTLHPETPIATPFGYRPAGKLRRGDTVTTDAGDVVPVLHSVHHTAPARGSFAPVRLHAPFFGLTRDIIVAPDQRLVLSGSDVEYTFGQEAVLVPARHLINGQAATWAAPASTVSYVQVILPGHEPLMAAGCALESLYIGRIRRKQHRLDASVLCQIPSRLLPEHARPIHQVLRPFEAITLIDQRAA